MVTGDNLKTRERPVLVYHKGGRCCLRELFITELKSKLKQDFTLRRTENFKTLA